MGRTSTSPPSETPVVNKPSSFLTIKELSEILRVKESWVYDKTRRKGPDTIPVIRAGKYCRFSIDEVMAWLKKKGEERDY